MKFFKRLIISVLIIGITGSFVFAESWIDEDFSAFGIKTIGIYAEGYADERYDDFEAAYIDSYMRQAVNTFRYGLCDYNAVTPKLMTPDYPLAGDSSSKELDGKIDRELAGYAEGLGWQTLTIENFEGESLSGLLSSAASDGIDGVLVARYYTIEYYVPISGYSRTEGYSTVTLSARVGKLQKGLGLLPALELYDTRTGARLWYSAYYTGALSKEALDNYQTHADNAGAFFVEGNAPEEKAVETMVSLAMDSGNFPSSNLSGERNESLTATRASSTHMFWTDYSEYDFYGTLIGAGYNFSYIGDFPLYYNEQRNGYNEDEEPSVCGTAQNAMMHSLTFPLFALGTRNISFEPGFYFGFMHCPGNTSIIQNEWAYEPSAADGSDYVLINTRTANATVWGLTVGMDAALKYYLRFSDNFSAFIGGRGLVEAWLVNVNDDSTEDLYYAQKAGGLVELDTFNLNASIVTGARFDFKTPLELIAMFTPVGPGSGPMITLGCNWHGATFEWAAPHAKNTEVMMYW